MSRGRPIIGPVLKVAMPRELIAQIDQARGRLSRAAYIREAVRQVAGTVGGSTHRTARIRSGGRAPASPAATTANSVEEICKCNHPIKKHGLIHTGADTRERGACTLCPCKLARAVAVEEGQ